MTTTTDQLPLTDTLTPATQAEVADAIRTAYEASNPIYPLCGRTALDYGFTPTRPGLGLDLTSLDHVVDYTPRDMTILVEAGVRMGDLTAALAAEGQHLPFDAPPGEATIGGIVATNWNGSRRLGHGTVRDYIIGIHAVDGRGVAFKGGGRVVKNVAGYDFCKLLTGSLGTLAVITQLAFKVKPLPEQSATVVAACADLATAEILLNRFVNLPAPPVAIDYLAGPWQLASRDVPVPGQAEIRNDTPRLAIRVEGTAAEVDWLADQVQYELWQGGGMSVARLTPADADTLWQRQIEFADRGPGDAADTSPLVLKISVPPSRVIAMIGEVRSVDPECTIQAHAASGIIFARFSKFKPADLTKILVGKLRPTAIQHGGSLTVASTTLDGLTPHIVWGGRTDAIVLQERVKQKFDPHNILNPDRFAYH